VIPSTFAVAADICPGPAALEVDLESRDSQMRRANSLNHDGQGQNILYADGSVRFAQTPFEGPLNDNIWTSGWSGDAKPRPPAPGAADGAEFVLTPAVLGALPAHANDVVMMPFDDLAMREAAESAWFWRQVRENLLFPAAIVILLCLAVLIAWRVRNHHRRRRTGA
jgi:prepilin-type processing-associated H-X9-DG protein